jgi:hypothetical protein
MRNQFTAGDAPSRPIASAWARCETRSATPPYGTAREKAPSSANGVDGPAPADADDDDLIRAVNLVDHAIDAARTRQCPSHSPHMARAPGCRGFSTSLRSARRAMAWASSGRSSSWSTASSTMKRRNGRRLSARPASS